MKSLERRFKNIEKRMPAYSSFICFSEAVRNQKFSKETINRWFNKLVDKDDYAKEDKRALLVGLYLSSNPLRTTEK